MTYNILEKYRDNLFRCLKCGACHPFCPTYYETLDEAGSARGRLALIHALIDGRIEPAKELSDHLSTCLSCMACSENCPNGVDAAKIINVARNEIVSRHNLASFMLFILLTFLKYGRPHLPLPEIINKFVEIYKQIPAGAIFDRLLPYVRGGAKRHFPVISRSDLRKELPEVIKVKNPVARIAYFTGCMTDLVYQDTGRAVAAFMRRKKVEIWMPKDQLCCGAPSYYMGDRGAAMDLAKKNIEALKKQNVDAVITSCATCGNMLKNVYPELMESSNLDDSVKNIFEKITDVHKFIADRLVDESIPHSKTGLNKRIKVTYHDPCHLRRGQKIFKEPRQLLKNLHELEYIEMNDANRCCGGAGMFNLRHYDLSNSIGKHKVNAIRKTGAEIVVTGCPSCRMQLEDVLHREGLDVEVIHTIELLRRFLNAD